MDGEQILRALIRSYMPDWDFDAREDDPAWALLCASLPLFAHTDALMQRMMEKHRAVFLDLFGCENRPGQPAGGWVQLLPAPDAPPVLLPAGTRFAAENGCAVQTARPVWLSDNRLEQIVLVEPASSLRQVVPHAADGSFPVLCPGDCAAGEEQRVVWQAVFADGFFSGAPVQLRPAPVLGDGCVWTLQSADGSETLAAKQTDAGVALSPLRQSAGHAGEIRIEASCPSGGGAVGSQQCQVVLPACECPPDAVVVEELPADGDDFAPFGDRLQLESCCYMACDTLLGRAAAVIDAAFSVSFTERTFGMELLDQPEPEYRLVMRHMPASYKPPMYHAVPQQAVWEYWNGQDWNLLPGCERLSGLFAQARTERVGLRFTTPVDWARAEVQGRAAFWLRLRLKRADDCYGLPCRQMVPRIQNLTFRADEALLQPQQTRLSGQDALDGLTADQPPAAYFKLSSAGPMQLLWRAEHEDEDRSAVRRWEYGAADGGFYPLAATDETVGLRCTGTLTLDFPAAFARSQHFGQNGFWLRVWNPPRRQGALYCHAVWAQAEQMDCVPEGGLQPWRQTEGLSGAVLLGAFGGGLPPETDEQTRLRAAHGLVHRSRAVTADDLSLLLRDAFREIASVACARTETGTLRVAVLLRDGRPPVWQQAREHMERFLAAHLPLGVGPVRITAPDLAVVHASVSVAGVAEQDWPAAKLRLEQDFCAYLNPLTGGAGQGWPLGVLPTARQLEARLNEALRETDGWVESCRLFTERPEGGQAWCRVAAGRLYAALCERKGAE